MMESLFPMLMCPYCGERPPNPQLELHKLRTSEIKDHGTRIHEGVVYCKGCTRYYSIRDEILFMSLDRIRE